MSRATKGIQKTQKMKICKCKMISPGGRKGSSEWRTGITKDSLYSTWKTMKNRCSENYRYKKYYYLRGIKVCEQWVYDFRVFRKDMGCKPSKSHSIDRVDNNLGYCPHNCRWATPSQQVENRRELFKRNGLPKWVSPSRFGFQVKRMINKKIVFGGDFKTLREAIICANRLGELQ